MRVEVAGGFVGDDERRVGDEGAGDGDALFLAAGELPGEVTHPVAQADEFEGGFNVLPAFATGQAGEEEREFDVFEGGQYRDEVESLEDETDVVVAPFRELGFGEVGDVDFVDVAVAAGGAVNAGNDMEERAFARAARAHEGDELTGGDVDRDVVEGGDLDFAVAVELGQVADLD